MAEASSPFPSRTSTDRVEAGSGGNIEKSTPDGKVVELDARALARECLKLVGMEMGMSH